ncbi:DEAH-box RNA helicase prp16 [Scheffersomyces spartinae]|uniref:RNA helicase n=1 Tax=Scheffersomyces spartinae TaxID=45513 RepID=A0A9P8AHE9_9ASCO|nr:DEAH-box RNA helicase prp16 [Scheffersomyces spartinae]KAG7193272.1 DEAH-box RNA helicase prp16 [Scheffersomyces spartinae]
MLAFSKCLATIGIRSEQQVQKIHSLIKDNYNELESYTNKPKKTLRIKLDLFEEEPELLPVAASDANGKAPSKVKKLKFKKISKTDAQRLRTTLEVDSRSEKSPGQQQPKILPVSQGETRAETNQKKGLSLLPLAEHEQGAGTEALEKDDFKFLLDNDNNVENDREWYMDDLKEEHETMETKIEEERRSKAKGAVGDNRTGGSYNEKGEYVDYDHDPQYDDSSRLQIRSHFMIPPFLDAHSESLMLLNKDNTQNGVVLTKLGPSISPIKDPLSELAVLASKGSFVLREARSKKEKAKQAKDKSSLLGTAMGKALGLKDGENDEAHHSRAVIASSDYDEKYDRAVIDKQRKSLPAYRVRSEVIRIISENQVTIIIGETGSGKTTQLTQFLYEEGFASNIAKGNSRKLIGCTQPRRVAAMSVAKRVSEEVGCKLGEEVGYAIRFEDMTSHDKTAIKYMTEGVLLRELLVDPYLEQYSCVIMDEAHERLLNTDILLGLLKQLVSKRNDLKLVITSATMNAGKFALFFGDAPCFTIPGRTFPVDIYFSHSSSLDYVESAVKQVLTIHLSNSANGNDGDILVFMTGQEDIEMVCQLIEEKLNLLEGPPPLDVLPIYSTMPLDLQRRIFNKTDKERRKCVVATNIAETSLTVDGIKYVIDSGLTKMKVYNPKLGMDALQVVPISIANADQRSGRAGRTGPGVAYRLYTERQCTPEQMYSQPIPEIQRTNLSNAMLLLKQMDVNDVNHFPFLDPPPSDLLNFSLYDLWSWGALTNVGELSDLGHKMTRLPMDPALSKLILLSCEDEFHCSVDVVKIVSLLSVPGIYYRPKERLREVDMVLEKFIVSESDHLTLLNIYNQFIAQLKKDGRRVSQWCSKNFLQVKSLMRARDIEAQIHLILKRYKHPFLHARNDDDIRKCICASFYHQLAKLSKTNMFGESEFVNLRHKYMKMYLHPTSGLNKSSLMTNYVVYHELILTSKEYMNCVTCVEPTWLLEYGPMFYECENHSSSHAVFVKQLETDRQQYEEKKSLSYSITRTKSSNEARPQSRNTSKFKKRRAF